MKPLRFLLLLLAVTFTARAADKPNIVLILADDLGINDLPCYGRAEHRTPNLDRLAGEGSAVHEQLLRAADLLAVARGADDRARVRRGCISRTSCPAAPMRRRRALKQPIIEGQLPLEEVTIAELLRDAGYATGHIGKWHLGNAGFGPKEQGFDSTYAGKANTTPSATEGSKGEYDLTAHAEQWIDQHKDRPFFLLPARTTLRTSRLPRCLRRWCATRTRSIRCTRRSSSISTQCVGRVMAKLDALGLRERTIFIFTSDNGGLHVLEFPGTPATHNTPFRAGKGYNYEGGLRVPLIIRWPGTVKPGWVSDTPVVLTDLVPTLLEAAGVDLAKQVGPLDGVSLVKLLAGGELAPRALFWHFPNYTNQGGRPGGAMREGDWKLVEHFEDGKTELYNLAQDIGETHDLAEKESARVSTMKARLAEWRASVGAQEMTPNPDFRRQDCTARSTWTRDPSMLTKGTSAAAVEEKWKEWRAGMNDAVKSSAPGEKRSRPFVTPAQGDIRLHAKDARVHGEKLRYEPQPQKNTLGFWTKPEDWADWEFEVKTPGTYEVEVTAGLRQGQRRRGGRGGGRGQDA